VVERLVNRLKQFRRIATRYEKRAVNYLAMLTIAAITLWLRHCKLDPIGLPVTWPCESITPIA
jgi:hypothetical protein